MTELLLHAADVAAVKKFAWRWLSLKRCTPINAQCPFTQSAPVNPFRLVGPTGTVTQYDVFELYYYVRDHGRVHCPFTLNPLTAAELLRIENAAFEAALRTRQWKSNIGDTVFRAYLELSDLSVYIQSEGASVRRINCPADTITWGVYKGRTDIGQRLLGHVQGIAESANRDAELLDYLQMTIVEQFQQQCHELPKLLCEIHLKIPKPTWKQIISQCEQLDESMRTPWQVEALGAMQSALNVPDASPPKMLSGGLHLVLDSECADLTEEGARALFKTHLGLAESESMFLPLDRLHLPHRI